MNAIHDADSGITWSNPHELIDHIVTNHHDYIRMLLPELEQLTDRVSNDADGPITNRERIEGQLNDLSDRLESHLTEQETWLFPLIRHLHEGSSESEWAYELDESVEWMMERMARENQALLDLAEQLSDSLRDQAWTRTDPRAADLAEQVRVLCGDVPKHIRLETESLFPCVRELISEDSTASDGLW